MIYLKTKQGQHVLVIEPGNLVDLKAGELIRSPGNEVMIAYTPDAVSFGKALMEAVAKNNLDPEEFDNLHRISMQQPERINRPYHDNIDILKKIK
jgi:hypothetical protein